MQNLNSTTHPYDEWAFTPLDFTIGMGSPLALAIYIYKNVDRSPSSTLFQVFLNWESSLPSRHKTTIGDVDLFFTKRQ